MRRERKKETRNNHKGGNQETNTKKGKEIIRDSTFRLPGIRGKFKKKKARVRK